MCIKPWLPDEILSYHEPSASATWLFSKPSCLKPVKVGLIVASCLWTVPRSIIWHWQGQLSQRNAPGNGCFLPQPSWLRMSPAASHPCSTVPVVHRSRLRVLCQARTILQRSNWEFQSRAAVGSCTAQPSFSLYHFCDFPLKSLCHLKEHRPVSFWVTVRLVGATNSAKWMVK